MRAFARTALTGLVALSLTVAAVPAQATNWTATINDVMALVYCLVGTGECDGLEPGADTIDTTLDNVDAFTVGVAALYAAGYNDGAVSVDVTTDNAEVIAAAMPTCDWDAGEVWDGDSCALPVAVEANPNCYMMGLCGQDGAGQLGITGGPYAGYTIADAEAVGQECATHYQDVLAYAWTCGGYCKGMTIFDTCTY